MRYLSGVNMHKIALSFFSEPLVLDRMLVRRFSYDR